MKFLIIKIITMFQIVLHFLNNISNNKKKKNILTALMQNIESLI